MPFFRVPAHETSDADVPLEALWGSRRAATLREQLLEGARSRRRSMRSKRRYGRCGVHHGCTRPSPMPSALSIEHHRRRALHAVTDADWAEHEAIHRAVPDRSRRDAEALLSDSSIPARLDAGASRAVDVDWTRVALDYGYFDEAHFIHDFQCVRGPDADWLPVASGRPFRTTSIFYNPPQTGSETMAVWQIQETPIAPLRRISSSRMPMPSCAFLKTAFSGTEVECQRSPDNRVMHAEMKIGDSLVMLGQAGEQLDTSPCSAVSVDR